MNIFWQFEGGEIKKDPLTALSNQTNGILLLPVELDVTNVLDQFTREYALDVLHLWKAPKVARLYLESGRIDLKDTAIYQGRRVRAMRLSPKRAAQKAAYSFGLTARGIFGPAIRMIISAKAWEKTGGKVKTDTWYAIEDDAIRLQTFNLVKVLSHRIVPVPDHLVARLEEFRRLRYETPELLPLYLGQWWKKGLSGLDLIEGL